MSSHCMAQQKTNNMKALQQVQCCTYMYYMLIRMSLNSSTVSPLVVSHRSDGKLLGHYSSTISVGSICLYPACTFTYQSSWQTTSSFGHCCSGWCSCVLWVKWYWDTIIPHARVHSHDQCGPHSCSLHSDRQTHTHTHTHTLVHSNMTANQIVVAGVWW